MFTFTCCFQLYFGSTPSSVFWFPVVRTKPLGLCLKTSVNVSSIWRGLSFDSVHLNPSFWLFSLLLMEVASVYINLLVVRAGAAFIKNECVCMCVCVVTVFVVTTSGAAQHFNTFLPAPDAFVPDFTRLQCAFHFSNQLVFCCFLILVFFFICACACVCACLCVCVCVCNPYHVLVREVISPSS